jgi:hypothetical protein
LQAWLRDGLEQEWPTDTLLRTALDVKTLCGSLQPHHRAVQLLVLLDQQTGQVLSQQPVDQKTNEAITGPNSSSHALWLELPDPRRIRCNVWGAGHYD